jgi:hypothetical protein
MEAFDGFGDLLRIVIAGKVAGAVAAALLSVDVRKLVEDAGGFAFLLSVEATTVL